MVNNTSAARRIDSRAKGARFERRIARFLSESLGIQIVRNISQSRAGGEDLSLANGAPLAVFNFAIECKHCRKSVIPTWWRQAAEQAKRVGRMPVLVYKLHLQKPVWMFREEDVRRLNPFLIVSTRTIDGVRISEVSEVSAIELFKRL